MPLRFRLGEAPNPDLILDTLQGKGPRGHIAVRPTHEGMVVSGLVPSTSLPPHMQVLSGVGNDSSGKNAGNDDDDDDDGEFGFEEKKQPQQQSSAGDEVAPPKSLAWLHKIIEDFYEFRTRQFAIKRSINATGSSSSSLAFALSDDDDRATRMIVPTAITDDVAFHLFEMISERYGVPTVVAQHSQELLETAKFFSKRDVTASLFFTLLKTPAFDSNDVRFIVEAKQCMRSSLVSQRGVDGLLRWFIPLRCVPHVLRRATSHPWAKFVLAKTHSAFEQLFRRQQIKLREEEQKLRSKVGASSASALAATRAGSAAAAAAAATAPLFTLPSPMNLTLVPPFSDDHPLVGRGPFVDVRGNEAFLAAQPPQLVIGADYLLCMLFVNWLDHRDQVLRHGAEGKPLEPLVQRRHGRVVMEKTVDASWNKLAIFAREIDAEPAAAAHSAQDGCSSTSSSTSIAGFHSPSRQNGARRVSALDELRLQQEQHHHQEHRDFVVSPVGSFSDHSFSNTNMINNNNKNNTTSALIDELLKSSELPRGSSISARAPVPSLLQTQLQQQRIQEALPPPPPSSPRPNVRAREQQQRQREADQQRKVANSVPPRILHLYIQQPQ